MPKMCRRMFGFVVPDVDATYSATGNRKGDLSMVSLLLSDWELWAVARRFIEDHGDMAAGYASLKATERDAQGDARGREVFLEVAVRINQLCSTEGTCH
ncbi:hypothetical protein DFR51_3770 [Sphingosinicella microcystinivorans]|uniref:Uncharacterized protein n=2 Tax=Sphingosinicella microcystinivorans TaxID=335406 RepID=A0ABX9SU75_SPHMI|nr:hypothetical protein DFR51_3770 [Sphingosinicella microcystinivorans]